ncbi:MAG TPA: hypothetical protein VML75_19035 [Kofleriaceae bacterium]|nr:hypothetical protein [Kofleriaceae bacterium]
MTTDAPTDERDDAIPAHDAPETESERHQARAFAKLVDGLVAGDGTPPALDADQRELIDVASTVRASITEVALERGRRDAIIDAAYARVLGARSSAQPLPAEVSSLQAARRSRLRYLPWATTVVAAAAAVALLVTRPTPAPAPVAQAHTQAHIDAPRLSDQHLSRPADLLIGKIPRAAAGQASARIDLIVADRMAGYRDLHLRGLAAKVGKEGGVSR